MVCSVGSGKMTVMATLSASANFSQLATENAGHQKVVAQYIQKELLEADDVNLLDEEDMHVFDLNPLTDPLILVSCNFCKKPVKASQFVSHSGVHVCLRFQSGHEKEVFGTTFLELCRSSGIAEDLLSELDGGPGNQKPPRKERKKLVSAGKRVSLTGGQERFAVVDASEKAVSCSQLDEQFGILSSCLVKAKEISRTVGNLAGETIPLTKRPKMIAADTARPSVEKERARGTSNLSSFQNSNPYVPAPLAAKTYTSQRSNRLQAAIGHMYHQSLVKGCINDREWHGNLVSEAYSIISEEEFNDHREKVLKSFYSVK